MAEVDKQFSVIIVGSGFASSFFLKRYLERAEESARVLVLERGQRVSHAERLKKKQIDADDADPVLGARKLFNNLNPRKDWAFTVGFGGSSNCWWACTPRFLPSDFSLHTNYGVGQDWPLSYEDLAPYYEEVESVFDVSGPPETAFPKKVPYPQPPHLLTTVDRMLEGKYPGEYFAQATARSRIARGKRSACCANGVCSLCPVDAKFTIENGMGDLYADPRVTLLCSAEVTAVDLQGNTAKGVFYSQEGEQNRASSDVVVLGANALFNPTLLMQSGDDSPHLGRGLCEQVARIVTVDLGVENVGGSTVINASGYMLYDGEHRRERAACLIESQNDMYLRLESGKHRHVAKFKLIYEDLPQSENRVFPSDDGRVSLAYEGHSDYTQRALDRIEKDVKSIFGVLPVEDLRIDLPPEQTESHILGTHRMGRSPEEGVVDAYGCHHRYRNLFVLGGGSFPTISPSNPTLTISALALRSAERLFV